MFVAVLSAVETALWDLAGKALGVPVYQLLGGKFRDKIRVYCDTALYQARCPRPSTSPRRPGRADMGYTAIKFDLDQANDPKQVRRVQLDGQPGELQRMVDQLTAAREAVGRTSTSAPTCTAATTIPPAAGGQAPGAAEPDVAGRAVPAENVDAYKLHRRVDQHADLRGRERLPRSWLPALLEVGAVDIIMPDLQKAGGLGEGQRIANLANLYYVPFAPHMVASFLGAMASATCARRCRTS